MEGAHRSSRGWVSFLLSPPPSSLASLCPRNKSAPAVVPKRQLRTCDCLAYSGGLEPAPLSPAPGTQPAGSLAGHLLAVFPRSLSILVCCGLCWQKQKVCVWVGGSPEWRTKMAKSVPPPTQVPGAQEFLCIQRTPATELEIRKLLKPASDVHFT